MPVAIVTGSDSGIGRATAVALARDGFAVGVTWHRDEAGARETAREIESAGAQSEVRRLDLIEVPDCADVVDELADALGGVDVFVNNAGTSRRAPFVDLTWSDWRETLAVDLDGAFVCAQRAARRMIAQGHGGRIVNVTSVHEHIPLPDAAPYVVAKHGLGARRRAGEPSGDPARPARRRTRDRLARQLACLAGRRVCDRALVRDRRRPAADGSGRASRETGRLPWYLAPAVRRSRSR